MNKTLPALPGKAPALPPGAFEIGYTAHDGAQHRVPLAEAAVVRFAGGATVSGCDLGNRGQAMPGVRTVGLAAPEAALRRWCGYLSSAAARMVSQAG